MQTFVKIIEAFSDFRYYKIHAESDWYSQVGHILPLLGLAKQIQSVRLSDLYNNNLL